MIKPSDLLGLRLLEYDAKNKNLSSALGPSCFEIRAVITYSQIIWCK